MRHRLSYIFGLMILLAGCTDSSYRGIMSELNTEEELPVRVIVGDPGYIEVRGTGAMEDDSDSLWNGKTINVYAFRRDLRTDYRTTSAAEGADCLIDGSRDSDGGQAGKEATVNILDSYISWTGKENVVYYISDTDPYDFFAYYTDAPVADEDIYRSVDDVKIMIDIDGSQDIMSAYAELTDEQIDRPEFTEADKLDLKAYSFSMFSARRNVQPIFYFRHHLTRFDFVIRAGRESSEDIIIDSLVVMSKTKAAFTVASKNPSRLGTDFSIATERKGLALTEKDGSPLRQDYWKPEFTEEGKDMRPLGGSMLVAPDIQYDAWLYLKEFKEEGKVMTHANHINLVCSDGRFDEGSIYEVKATIFGLTSVDVSVTLQEWTEAGSVNIGNDKLEEENL